MIRYSLIPTETDGDLTNLTDAWWAIDDSATGNLERYVIAECRKQGFSGAHVFTGSDGPIYGDEGYEDNYCGWIDAREAR